MTVKDSKKNKQKIPLQFSRALKSDETQYARKLVETIKKIIRDIYDINHEWPEKHQNIRKQKLKKRFIKKMRELNDINQECLNIMIDAISQM